MSTLEEENEQLRKLNAGLEAILSIIKLSLKSDFEYNSGLLERLMSREETEWGGIDEATKWNRDSRFKILDMDGEHDPVYVVTPSGDMIGFNNYNDTTTDLARAHFTVDALNLAWDKVRKTGELNETRGKD